MISVPTQFEDGPASTPMIIDPTVIGAVVITIVACGVIAYVIKNWS